MKLGDWERKRKVVKVTESTWGREVGGMWKVGCRHLKIV